MYRLTLFTCLGLLLANRVSAEEPKSFYDRLPSDARCCLASKNFGELLTKSERLLKESDWEPEIPLHEALGFLLDYFNLKDLVQSEKEVALVLVNRKVASAPDRVEDLFDFVSIFAVKNRKKLAQDLQIATEALVEGKIVATKLDNRLAERVLVEDGFAYLGSTEKAIESVRKGKRLTADLSPAERKSLAESDLVFTLRPQLLMSFIKVLVVDALLDSIGANDDSIDPDLRKMLTEAARGLNLVLMTFRIDDGVHFRIASHFEKDQAQDLLRSLGSGAPPVSLDGLAPGKLLFAQASTADGSRTAPLLRTFASRYLSLGPDHGSILDRHDHDLYLGILSDIWSQQKGSRIAFYENDRPEKDGLWSGTAIFRTDDSKAFLDHLRKLARIDATGQPIDEKTEIEQSITALSNPRYRTREAGTTRLMLIGPPCLPALEATLQSADADLASRVKKIRDTILAMEKVRKIDPLSKQSLEPLRPHVRFQEPSKLSDGTAVENLKIHLRRDEKRVVEALREYFGEGWSRIPFASVGHETAFSFGSDESRFAATLRALKEKQPRREKETFAKDFSKQADPGRQLEIHLSLERLFRIRQSYPQEKFDPKRPAGVSSFGLTAHENRVLFDLWVPIEELRAYKLLSGYPSRPR